jgi:PAS domain-containing protein
MMTTEADVKIAVQAMKIGVHDYVVKTSAVLSGITRIVQRGLREWSHIQGCKRAENFLRESDANYRLLFDNANDAIFIIDAQKRIIEVNPPAVERFGYTYAELTSMSLDQLDPLEQGKDRIARLLEQGHPGNLRHSYG